MRTAPVLALLAVLAGCGGGDGGSGPANTVAGCKAATVKAITTGDLADTNAPDYPECVGLSAADLMQAGQEAFDDPGVKAYIADLVDKGTGASEATPKARPPDVKRGVG